jgi:WD40 repeat protein
VDDYFTNHSPVAFSPDGKWLATGWTDADSPLRLWPLPGSGVSDVRFLKLPDPFETNALAFDSKGRYLFAVGSQDFWIVPLDGSPPRKQQRLSEDSLPVAAAVSPSGRVVATAFALGQGDKTLRVWDVETDALRSFDLPDTRSAIESGTGWEQGVMHLSFADDSTLYTLGDGGLYRWNLEAGSHELVAATSPGYGMVGRVDAERGVAITGEKRWGEFTECSQALLHDLKKGTSRRLTKFGDCSTWRSTAVALDPSGTVAATGSVDGIVRVGRLTGAEPHLLLGHKGAVMSIAISPDLHWVATTGFDRTLRLWPMPDLSKPPLHTLPHDELLAKLRSLTNLRVVRDPSSATGWKVEVGLFPGWAQQPEW